MRESIRDRQRQEHILSVLDVIISYRQQYSDDEIICNPITFFGFVKHLEIIGEAAYKLTKELKATHPQVYWHEIEGMRHIMVHGYYLIEKSIVISTLREDIDFLKQHILNFLSEQPLHFLLTQSVSKKWRTRCFNNSQSPGIGKLTSYFDIATHIGH